MVLFTLRSSRVCAFRAPAGGPEIVLETAGASRVLGLCCDRDFVSIRGVVTIVGCGRAVWLDVAQPGDVGEITPC